VFRQAGTEPQSRSVQGRVWCAWPVPFVLPSLPQCRKTPVTCWDAAAADAEGAGSARGDRAACVSGRAAACTRGARRGAGGAAECSVGDSRRARAGCRTRRRHHTTACQGWLLSHRGHAGRRTASSRSASPTSAQGLDSPDGEQAPLMLKAPAVHVATGLPVYPAEQLPAHVEPDGVLAAQLNAPLATVGEPVQAAGVGEVATNLWEAALLQRLITRRAPAARPLPSVSRHIVDAWRGRRRPALSTANLMQPQHEQLCCGHGRNRLPLLTMMQLPHANAMSPWARLTAGCCHHDTHTR
jgi:hypothetical protein